MRTFKHILVGLVTVTFLIGGVAMIPSLGSEAEAGGFWKHYVTNKDLRHDHWDILDGLEKIEEAIGELGPEPAGPPCGEGTEGQRFVVIDTGEIPVVCDNNSGLEWEQNPDSFDEDTNPEGMQRMTWVDAQSICLDLGSGFRLPLLGEIVGLIDSTILSPLTPGLYPVIPSVFNNVRSGFRDNPNPEGEPIVDAYWTASTASVLEGLVAWAAEIGLGTVTTSFKTTVEFVWCVRDAQSGN